MAALRVCHRFSLKSFTEQGEKWLEGGVKTFHSFLSSDLHLLQLVQLSMSTEAFIEYNDSHKQILLFYMLLYGYQKKLTIRFILNMYMILET